MIYNILHILLPFRFNYIIDVSLVTLEKLYFSCNEHFLSEGRNSFLSYMIYRLYVNITDWKQLMIIHEYR